MNILLVCAAGMSTSLLVNHMQKAAKEKDIDLTINARPIGEVEQYGPEADIILLGPQVRYQAKRIKELYPDKPSYVIDMRDYGMMKGEKVLNDALKALGK